MRKILLILLSLIVLLSACDKAPDGVIKESVMEDFLVDLYKAEAIIEVRPEEFSTDADKIALKQAVFDKYGVTQEMYDSSLMWYAHNVEIYDKVFQNVTNRLEEEKKDIQGDNTAGPQQMMGGNNGGTHKMYAAAGDTADLWNIDRTWLLVPGMKQTYITFECLPGKEYKQGDRYSLNMKMFNLGNNFSLVLACEYMDGSVSMQNTESPLMGWNKIDLQSDSTRKVRRIYGYIKFKMNNPTSVSFLDSIALVRTHLSKDNYSYIVTQKFISRDKNATKPGTAPQPMTAPANPPKPVVPANTGNNSAQADQASDAAISNFHPATLKDDGAAKTNAPKEAPKGGPSGPTHGTPPKLFKPKAGVNKSGNTKVK